jgi:hypothetical protein
MSDPMSEGMSEVQSRSNESGGGAGDSGGGGERGRGDGGRYAATSGDKPSGSSSYSSGMQEVVAPEGRGGGFGGRPEAPANIADVADATDDFELSDDSNGSFNMVDEDEMTPLRPQKSKDGGGYTPTPASLGDSSFDSVSADVSPAHAGASGGLDLAATLRMRDIAVKDAFALADAPQLFLPSATKDEEQVAHLPAP